MNNAIAKIILWSLTLVVLVGVLIAGLGLSRGQDPEVMALAPTAPTAPAFTSSAPSAPTAPTLAPTTEPAPTTAATGAPAATGTVPAESAAVASADTLGTTLVSTDGVRELEIDWLAGSISIRYDKVDEIQITETGTDGAPALTQRLDGQTLKIDFCAPGLWSNFRSSGHEKDLTIVLPRDFAPDQVEIDGTSCALTVERLSARSVEADLVSGECRFEDCAITGVEVDTTSGDVYYSGTVEVLECDTTSGSVYAELYAVPSRVEMDTVSGMLELGLPQDAGFTLLLETVSGKFATDFTAPLKNGAYVCGNGACRVEMESTSGGVVIYKVDDGPTAAHQHTDDCLAELSTCPDAAVLTTVAGHHHSLTCLDDPTTCPGSTHHDHRCTCQTAPNTCPVHHT